MKHLLSILIFFSLMSVANAHTHSPMEENTLVNGKMVINTAKVHSQRSEKPTLVNLKMINSLIDTS